LLVAEGGFALVSNAANLRFISRQHAIRPRRLRTLSLAADVMKIA
jgi:hypothetical protein